MNQALREAAAARPSESHPRVDAERVEITLPMPSSGIVNTNGCPINRDGRACVVLALPRDEWPHYRRAWLAAMADMDAELAPPPAEPEPVSETQEAPQASSTEKHERRPRGR